MKEVSAAMLSAFCSVFHVEFVQRCAAIEDLEALVLEVNLQDDVLRSTTSPLHVQREAFKIEIPGTGS
jgi:hypothetical protein